MRRSRLSLAAGLRSRRPPCWWAIPAVAAAAPSRSRPVQLIAMNDFHGRISQHRRWRQPADHRPRAGRRLRQELVRRLRRRGTRVGGAANVATTVKRPAVASSAGPAGGAAAYFVGAGDLISASPFESSVFKDEPTIEVAQRDRGWTPRPSATTSSTAAPRSSAASPPPRTALHRRRHRLRGRRRRRDRLLRRRASTPSTAPTSLPGRQRRLQGDRRADAAAVPGLRHLEGGKQVALIGVVTETTPTIVSPDGVGRRRVHRRGRRGQPVRPRADRRQGVQAIGVLVHEGGVSRRPAAPTPTAATT